jgi:hypothetical protein
MFGEILRQAQRISEMVVQRAQRKMGNVGKQTTSSCGPRASLGVFLPLYLILHTFSGFSWAARATPGSTGAPVDTAQLPKRAALSDEEADKIREEQDPGKRIELYLAFAQDRLTSFETFREKPDDPEYNTAKYLDDLLGEYIALNEEMKDWIQDQYERGGDMRAGLRKLVEVAPQQLEQLRHIQQTSDPRSSVYGHSVEDAIDDLTDTIDGGTKALADQVKKLGELKKDEKADARAEKERAKEAQKRQKEEKKLQKKERKQHKVPTDEDQQ